MNAEFKFKVGDLVVPKVSMENCKLYAAFRSQSKKDRIVSPQIMVVNQRQMDECPGGTQYHYLCRLWVEGQESRLVSFNEIELQSWDIQEWLTLFPKID